MEMELASIFNGYNFATDHKTISVLHAKFIMADELGELYETAYTKSHSLCQKIYLEVCKSTFKRVVHS